MDSALISVYHLSKTYKTRRKQPGIINTFRSLFKKNYSITTAVDNISFSVGKGEIIGLIGPNGAGKTTILKMLSGLLWPTHGRIKVIGFSPQQRKKEFLKKISLVMGQKNQLWWDLPAIETFLLNKEIYQIPADLFEKNLKELTALLDAKDIIYKQTRQLSLGERMKCELIASLLHSPQVLFLDEPTIGLDIIMQQKIQDFIKKYNRKQQTTIVLTSHYMADIQKLCPKIIIINHGRIIYNGPFQNISAFYSAQKIIRLTLSGEVNPDSISKIAKIKDYHFPIVTLVVPQAQSASITNQLLNKLPIIDLVVQQMPIEETIKKIFTDQPKN